MQGHTIVWRKHAPPLILRFTRSIAVVERGKMQKPTTFDEACALHDQVSKYGVPAEYFRGIFDEDRDGFSIDDIPRLVWSALERAIQEEKLDTKQLEGWIEKRRTAQ